MLESVEKPADPTRTHWPQIFLRARFLEKRVSLAQALFLLSHGVAGWAVAGLPGRVAV